MMKYFFPTLIVVVVLAGVIKTFSPFVMNAIFPVEEDKPQIAMSERAKVALADWFGTTPDMIVEARAFREIESKTGNKTLYFSFSTYPDEVRQFIRLKKLEQADLTPQILDEKFSASTIQWWMPAKLDRKTWFHGDDNGADLSLIYNAQVQQGFLVIRD